MKLSRLVLAGACAATATIALAWLWDEIPYWSIDGALMAENEPLPPIGDCPAVSGELAVILFAGDSNMSGSRVGGTSHAFPALLGSLLEEDPTIINAAVGGATIMSERRQGDSRRPPDAPMPDLVIAMFGTNDAAPRGMLGNKRPVARRDFAENLEQFIVYWQERGARVLVLAAPPTGSDAMARRIAPYRIASRTAAANAGAAFRDPAEAFKTDGGGGAMLQFDGLHLNRDGQRILARWLAECLASPVRACKRKSNSVAI